MQTLTIRPIVSLATTQKAMDELAKPGKSPLGKLAFWNAALSARQKLHINCAQADVMRGYAFKPLPLNPDELKAQLGPCLPRTIVTLYEIEKLWNAGLIHMNAGDTFELQSKWRDSMRSLIYGMSYKTVSFALNIFAASRCKLLTIDVWHARRLDNCFGDVKDKNYLAYELALRADCVEMEALEPGYATCTYAACLWERARQAAGKSEAEDGEYQSHAGLSCYV